MVIPVFYVMARRRKGAVGRRSAKTSKASLKNIKKSSEQPVDKPNGSVFLSPAEVKAVREIKTSMCTGDTHSASEQSNPVVVQSTPIAHKKFGKFRCLLEVRETEAAICNTFVAPNVIKDSEEDDDAGEQESEEIQEVVIGPSDVDISESEQVVWEEEVVEELVVCEGVEIEEEEDEERIPPETLVLEETDSKDADCDQVIEIADVEYCNQIESIVTCRESEYSNNCRKIIDSDNIPQINRIAYTCNINSVQYPTLQSSIDRESKSESVERRLGINCLDGYGLNDYESKIPNSIITDRVAYDIQNNVVSMMKGVTLDQETFVVEVPDSDEQLISESEQEKYGIQNRDYDYNREQLVTKAALKQCPPVTYFSNDYVGRSLDCVDSNIHSRNFLPSLINSNKLGIKNHAENSSFNDIQGKLLFHNANSKDMDEDCHTSQFSDFKIGEDESDRKQQPVFRSRSGSTDTTGSESSSSCSTGVRRSSRIRSIGATRQRVRGKNDNLDSNFCASISADKERTEIKVPECETPQVVSLYAEIRSGKNEMLTPLNSIVNLPVITTSSVQSYDSDCSKPVKVKSRWRRSSELEMGGNRSSDSELATPPTPSISPRPLSNCLTGSSPRLVSPRAPPSLLTGSNVSEDNLDVGQKKEIRNEKKERDDKEMEERLRSFSTISENEYHTDRSTSKEAKRMVCDCFLTKEELSRGDMGCGEDCLNRLLMIECGSRCAVGDRCSNKHFQKHEYAKCDVFKTEKKGFGLRTLDDLPAGAFIMEYVGEVLDPKEFRRRAKEYAKEKNQHYYFMALKSDAIIDATVKGNTSRFINHSCEPNAETQKWTVNGELRIGFFSKRQILAEEEITFDYQFQRYGKEAQRCYCETPSCRGWIGEDPEKEKRERKERKERELKKKREERRKDVKEYLDDMDLEEEIEKLGSSGLKNRAHTLTMCRLMVRAEDSESRIQLLKLIQEGVPACRRLFLDYHGLRLIWSWMMNSSTNCENPDLDLRIEILETLAKLPIPNKTMIQDSKVMSLVEKWLQDLESTSFLNENEISGSNVICHKILKKERISVEEESISDQEIKTRDDSCRNQKSRMGAVLPSIDDDDEETTQDIEDEKQIVDVPSEIPLADLLVRRGSESDDEGYGEATDKSSQPDDCDMKEETTDKKHVFMKIAIKLLNEWNQLKEVFRIPKKERIEQMKEHEREADRGYKEYLDKEGHHDKQSYDRHWRQERFRSDYDKRKRLRDSPDVDRMRKTSRLEDSSRVLIPIPKMSKQERRHLFALKVAQKDEEERQRRQQQELWRQHEDQCMALGVDPNLTAFNNAQTGYPFYFNPASGTWQPYPAPDQNSVTSEAVSYTTQSTPVESPLLPSPQLVHNVPSAIGLPPQVSHPPGRPPPLLPSPHLPPPTHGPPPGCPPQTFPSHLPPPHLPPSSGQPLMHHVPPPALGPPPPHGPPSLPPPPHNSHLPPQGPPPCHGPPLHGLPPHRQPPPQGPPTIHGPPTHVPPPHHIPPPQGPPPNLGPSLLGPHPHTMPPPPHGPPPAHGQSQSHRPPLLPLPHYPPLPPGVPQPGQPNHREIHITSHTIGQAPMVPGSYEPNGGHPSMPYDNVSHPTQTVMNESGMTEIPLPAGPHPIVGTTVYQHPPPHLVYSSPQPINQTQPQYNVHPTTVPIQQPFNPNAPPLPPQPIKLPPKWKSAKDSEGRTYYYHVKTRISQWEPPPWNQGDPQPESDSSTDSSEDDEDEDEEETSTTDDDEEEDEDEAEQEEKTEEYEEEEDATDEKDDVENLKDTPSVSRARMTSPERLTAPLTQENHQVKHVAEESRRKERRREGLVQERIISPRREEDRPDVSYREIKEKLRRKKELALGRARSDRSKKYHRDGKQRSSSKSEKPVTVAADTSSDTARKIKDQFRLQMAGVIVQYLNPYRKPDCQKGRITNTEDFKHLARKLTHFVMLKELKHCRSVEDLECNDNVKHKARDFIKKYMTKFGTVYQRPKDDE